MTSLIYNDGTVAVTFNSVVVVGSLTGWAVGLVSGGLFSCGGMSVPIASVEDDTHLTLAYSWPGGSASGLAYAIARDTSEAVRAAWTNDRLATIIQRLSLVGIHPDGSGTLAERNALNPVPATGYIWLYAEVGHDLAIYRKSAAGWDGPFEIRGEAGAAAPQSSLADLSDVTLTNPVSGKVLRFNGAAWVDAALTPDIVNDSATAKKFATGPQLAKLDGLPDAASLTASLNAKAPLASPALTGTPTAPTAAPGTNTTQLATTAFVQAAFGSNDAVIYKGDINCSTNPNYPAADRGHVYRVSAAGKIGGAGGVNVEAGDMLTCRTDGTLAGNQATVGGAWTITQTNIDGAVIGPPNAGAGRLTMFADASGKTVADAGVTTSAMRVYEIGIYESVGIFPGLYPDSIVDLPTTLSAGRVELRDGSADAAMDVWLLRDGSAVAGPWRVTLGGAVDVTGAAIALAAGNRLALCVGYVAGSPYDLVAKFWGV